MCCAVVWVQGREVAEVDGACCQVGLRLLSKLVLCSFHTSVLRLPVGGPLLAGVGTQPRSDPAPSLEQLLGG